MKSPEEDEVMGRVLAKAIIDDKHTNCKIRGCSAEEFLAGVEAKQKMTVKP